MSKRVQRTGSAFRKDLMAYVVLAVGALMWLVGVYAIVSGYPIIQIERGWTTVIAGSTMFTGGLVTMAVGLVLGALLRIEVALEARPVSQADETNVSAMSDDVGHGADFETRQVFEPALNVPSQRPEMASFAAEPAPVFAAPRYVPPVFPPLPPLHVGGEPDEPHGIDHNVEDPTHVAFDDEAYERLHEMPAPEHPHDSGTVYEPDHADHYELQTPSTPEHDLAPPVETAPPVKIDPASHDDWLDRAFSSLDEELSLGPEHRHPDRDEAEHDSASHTHVAEAEHEPSPHREDEPASHAHAAEEHEAEVTDALEWAPPAPDVAVIGRYESDGTTYVMFADGSIEAQSEAGVYRFRSMAELKAFIEG